MIKFESFIFSWFFFCVGTLFYFLVMVTLKVIATLTISCLKVGGKWRMPVCCVCYAVHILKRFVAVVAMACLSSSRLCARVQDKLLCQFGHKVRKQTVFVKLKPPGPSPLRIFGKTCQVRQFNFSFDALS